MKRTTILADDDLILEVKQLAIRQGRTFTALLNDALREYVDRHRQPRRISFAGIGRSAEPLDHDRIDEVLKAGLDPHEGWSPRRSEPEENPEPKISAERT